MTFLSLEELNIPTVQRLEEDKELYFDKYERESEGHSGYNVQLCDKTYLLQEDNIIKKENNSFFETFIIGNEMKKV